MQSKQPLSQEALKLFYIIRNVRNSLELPCADRTSFVCDELLRPENETLRKNIAEYINELCDNVYTYQDNTGAIDVIMEEFLQFLQLGAEIDRICGYH